MARYQLYYLRDNLLVGSDDIEAVDDREAARIARSRGAGKRVEVWNAHRRVNVVAADTDDEARFLASSGRQSFASLRSGRPIQLPPPSKEWERDPSDPRHGGRHRHGRRHPQTRQ